MWKAIPYVTGGFTLAAFVVAAIVFVLRTSLLQKERLIIAAPESKRADLVKSALEFFNVDTSGLTKQQQFDLAMAQIKSRTYKSNIAASLTIIVAILAAGLTALAIVQKNRELSEASVSPDYVNVGFSEDLPLEQIVRSVAETRNVTIVFDQNCNPSVPAAIIEKGNHSGQNIKEFLENLRERVKGVGINYSVKRAGERRYEIICY
jgi:hypothetical protein